MKSTVVIILAAILFHFSCSAQFSLRVFPIGVSGDPYADTLLNTRAVLSKAGIKQINAYQTLAEVTKTFATKTVNLDREGRIENMTICSAENKLNGFTLCIYDTITYDSSGYMVKIQTTDTKGNDYPPVIFRYTSEREFVAGQDSSASFHSYNEIGQFAALRRTLHGKETEITRFYYNSDGLLDSTYNTFWGTFVFKRRNKGKRKLVEMENEYSSYQWVYSPAGQCIRHIVISKDRPNVVRSINYKGDLKSEFNYFYNSDGTLAKVVTKRSDMPTFTMYYSYVKY